MTKDISITQSVHTIELTSESANSLAWDIHRGLSASIRDHYVNHPDAFFELEENSLKRMKLFFSLGNSPKLYDTMVKEFENSLNSAREKKQTA